MCMTPNISRKNYALYTQIGKSYTYMYMYNVYTYMSATQRYFYTLSGVGAVRRCPKCHYVNAPSKKRCQRCGEFMVGRHCPECGTLNHNRTRECFRCNATIEDGEPCLVSRAIHLCTVQLV